MLLVLNLVMETNFFYDYLVKPIISPELQGYNLVNTVIYIAILVIACSAIFIALRKKINFDEKFFITLIPYILFGISMRVIMHQIESGHLIIKGITKTANPMQIGFWFFTPGIWILTFCIVLIGLLLAGVWKKEKELNYKNLFWFGAIITFPLIIFNLSKFDNWMIFIGAAVLIAIVSYGLCWIINKFTKYKILNDKLNLFIVTGQAIDGIASTIAITFFNFSEQHVVSNLVLSANPIFFPIIKLGIAAMICWSLDDYLKDALQKCKSNPEKLKLKQNLVGFIKVIIAILGFATGLASLFKLGII